MKQVEIVFGGKPTIVKLDPSENWPDVPHKVLGISDMESGEAYLPGPEMLLIEGFYQGMLDYQVCKLQKTK